MIRKVKNQYYLLEGSALPEYSTHYSYSLAIADMLGDATLELR
jgi:hypothetical protein